VNRTMLILSTALASVAFAGNALIAWPDDTASLAFAWLSGFFGAASLVASVSYLRRKR
jgi:hypothetical protein